MTRLSSLSQYPEAFLTAFQRANADGVFRIPTKSPHRLRMILYGFSRVARREGRGELIDPIMIVVEPDAIVLKIREKDPLVEDIQNALLLTPQEGEEMFDRLFPEHKPEK